MAAERARAPRSSMGDKVLAFAEGGSIKRLRVGAEAAEANLRMLLKDVFLTQAGECEDCGRVSGVASATMPGVAEWITAVLRDSASSVRSGGRRSDRARCSFQGRPRDSADRRHGLQHHWPRARRQPRERRRLELAAWRLRAPATGSACMQCAARCTPTTAKSRRRFLRRSADLGHLDD